MKRSELSERFFKNTLKSGVNSYFSHIFKKALKFNSSTSICSNMVVAFLPSRSTLYQKI